MDDVEFLQNAEQSIAACVEQMSSEKTLDKVQHLKTEVQRKISANDRIVQEHLETKIQAEQQLHRQVCLLANKKEELERLMEVKKIRNKEIENLTSSIKQLKVEHYEQTAKGFRDIYEETIQTLTSYKFDDDEVKVSIEKLTNDVDKTKEEKIPLARKKEALERELKEDEEITLMINKLEYALEPLIKQMRENLKKSQILYLQKQAKLLQKKLCERKLSSI